jgi:hypothetical protein
MKRLSTSYVFTADIKSAGDMMRIDEIKNAISGLNKMTISTKSRVVLRGRKPEVKKITSSGRAISYDQRGNIVGGIANATMIDVYIYRRR